MSLLVIGSVAYDSVTTPAGSRGRALGGSATYFSIAASHLTSVGIVGIVGEDFEQRHIDLFASRGIDMSGLEHAAGKTFHWSGAYSPEDTNQRDTLDTQLNVFADFEPTLSAVQRESEYLFLANIDPELQLSVLKQMRSRPRLIGLDSMNFWIDGKRAELDAVVSEVDIVFMDEGEARIYSEEANLVMAARRILERGPRAVVLKRGEHGVTLFDGESVFSAPAFPLDSVIDPTGAGDAFAGGFMGAVAATEDTSNSSLRRAAITGSAMGSFTVQAFSADKLANLTNSEFAARFEKFIEITGFEPFDNSTAPWRNS